MSTPEAMSAPAALPSPRSPVEAAWNLRGSFLGRSSAHTVHTSRCSPRARLPPLATPRADRQLLELIHGQLLASRRKADLLGWR